MSDRLPRTVALTALAMVAFAANSVLCRLALAQPAIDAASFSLLRLLSGALTLVVLLRLGSARRALRGSWASALALFAYVAAFSFSYLSLAAGTGALLLFGAVQVTMIVAALVQGERPGSVQWLGFAAAVAGLVYLVSPGLAAPAPGGAALMTVAGVAWGVYSIRGRASPDALADTAGNFARAVPLAVLLSLIALGGVRLSAPGALLAVTSGALTSGLGYVVWYAALRGLSGMQAAMVQLSVPLLAALGGTVFIAEPVTLRLVASSVLIIGGVAAAVAGGGRRRA